MRSLAKEIDVPANRLTELIAERSGMTADMAIRLARYFGGSAEFWMNLQSMYDLTKAVVEKRKVYTSIAGRKAA